MRYDHDIIRQQLDQAKSRDLITLTCHYCNKSFNRAKNEIQTAIAKGKGNIACSITCGILIKSINNITKPCGNCKKEVTRTYKEAIASKTGEIFCSRSCSAIYHNSHKTTGTRRSKLEIWLEKQLTIKYPQLFIQFNIKEIINSELDIYIPSIKLAFELNGIFHYEPIYGFDKLESIQNNDDRKFQACLEHGIELCIIDSSKQKTVNEKTSTPYLDIVTQIINLKLSE